MEDRRVVVVADALVFHHVLEIADDARRGQIASAGRNQRLVHVQGDGASRADASEIDPAFRQEHRPIATGAHRVFHQGFRTADHGQAIDVFWKLAHA